MQDLVVAADVLRPAESILGGFDAGDRRRRGSAAAAAAAATAAAASRVRQRWRGRRVARCRTRRQRRRRRAVVVRAPTRRQRERVRAAAPREWLRIMLVVVQARGVGSTAARALVVCSTAAVAVCEPRRSPPRLARRRASGASARRCCSTTRRPRRASVGRRTIIAGQTASADFAGAAVHGSGCSQPPASSQSSWVWVLRCGAPGPSLTSNLHIARHIATRGRGAGL